MQSCTYEDRSRDLVSCQSFAAMSQIEPDLDRRGFALISNSLLLIETWGGKDKSVCEDLMNFDGA